MKAKLLLLSSICLLVPIAKVFAQDADTTKKFNDYIISLKNDTIKCHLGSRFSGKLTYKVDGAHRAKPFDADSVNGFYRSEDSSFFVPRRLPGADKLTFLRLLERGKINLYEKNASNANSISFFWYVSKNNDSLKFIKIGTTGIYIGSSRKSREQVFMNLIADNPALLDKYKEERKSTNYNFELIEFYVKLYNDGFLENQKTSK
ncbi:hypothetical protein [Mucilaginibacter sp. BT774]|uniref:hypothetical protein n=1 Tax=Mucilaginibacter sp. BT774 TaxID=3062276 RepID=UPI0026749698|nr:hypothetical protein [Mucilaginibacter sp. BT774]MDO3626179.1 hypothetical protein [Mucilaginibacter sp. BT774]